MEPVISLSTRIPSRKSASGYSSFKMEIMRDAPLIARGIFRFSRSYLGNWSTIPEIFLSMEAMASSTNAIPVNESRHRWISGIMTPPLPSPPAAAPSFNIISETLISPTGDFKTVHPNRCATQSITRDVERLMLFEEFTVVKGPHAAPRVRQDLETFFPDFFKIDDFKTFSL